MCLDFFCLFLDLIHTRPLTVHTKAIFVELLIVNSRCAWNIKFLIYWYKCLNLKHVMNGYNFFVLFLAIIIYWGDCW